MGLLFGKRKEQRTFWVTLSVVLAEPLLSSADSMEGGGHELFGYYQNFGVTTSTAALALEAASAVALQGRTMGTLQPETTSVREVDVQSMDEGVRRRVGSRWKKPGIWYQSGRIFIYEDPDDDDDDETPTH